MSRNCLTHLGAFVALTTALHGCVKGGTDDAKFAKTVNGQWKQIGGQKTLQFQPEATDYRPGAANIAGKEYEYEFPDDTHIRFFAGSNSLIYAFQISGNQLILQPQNGSEERYQKRLYIR